MNHLGGLPMVGDHVLFERGADDAARAEKMFGNQGLHTAARAFAVSHTRAIQYLEQAPVLAMGAAQGGVGVRRLNLLFIQHKITPLCERGAALKDVMAAFGLTFQLRKLKASALFPSAAPVLAELGKLSPAVLGRIIPEKPGLQRRWLIALVSWRDQIRRRQRVDEHFAWAADRMSTAGSTHSAAAVVADFVSEPDEHFNPAWQWPRAEDEANAWHARMHVGSMLRKTPFKPDSVIDLGRHPDVAEHRGYTFHALRTPLDVAAEGGAMHHCVASYVGDVIRGRCHIVSVRKNDRRVATLELSGGSIAQLKGPCNANLPAEVWSAAQEYRIQRTIVGDLL